MPVADAAMTLPASMYRDPAVYECERAAVFGREWEAVQRDLDAAVYTGGRLSPRHEAGVAQVQRLVRAALERAPVERP